MCPKKRGKFNQPYFYVNQVRVKNCWLPSSKNQKPETLRK
jgi:hypothetical protein